MLRLRLVDLSWVVVACAVVALLVALDPAAGIMEWVFGSFLLGLGGFVVRSAWRAAVRARAEHVRATRLAATEPGAVALAAIGEERQRLSEEIAGELRDAFGAILDEATTLDAGDPRLGLRRIHARTQLATSELRRQLGLLRSPEPARISTEGAEQTVPRPDVWLAAGLAALALVEVPAYLLIEGPREDLPWAVPLSALAAACVVGRRVAPAAACTACAVVFALGWLTGYDVVGGFWPFGTLGALVWTVVARARLTSVTAAAGVLLVVTVVWTRRETDPANLGVVVALMTVAAALGLAVRVAGWREVRSLRRAEARETVLADAARAAVEAERAGFARELHDLTSHAVGLIAMQAAAAQVSWPRDPQSVRRAVSIVERTARGALLELDRLGAGRSAARGAADLHELVGRIRAAGTRVELTLVGDLPAPVGTVVHRIVQEALTNAVRHASGAAVRVEVVSDAEGVRTTVRDDGAGPRDTTTRGYGLVGLSERVALAGGSLRTGQAERGGFLVEATLPVANPAVAP